MKRREALIFGGAGIAALAAGALVGALGIQSATGAGKLLSASFPDLSGRLRQLSDWRGRVVLFNFWATWCAPCREEMPVLDAMAQKYAFSAVGIGIDSVANVRQFAANFSIRYEILVGSGEAVQLMKDIGNPGGGLPFSLLLDQSGRIASRKLGAFEQRELEGLITPLLR